MLTGHSTANLCVVYWQIPGCNCNLIYTVPLYGEHNPTVTTTKFVSEHHRYGGDRRLVWVSKNSSCPKQNHNIPTCQMHAQTLYGLPCSTWQTFSLFFCVQTVCCYFFITRNTQIFSISLILTVYFFLHLSCIKHTLCCLQQFCYSFQAYFV